MQTREPSILQASNDDARKGCGRLPEEARSESQTSMKILSFPAIWVKWLQHMPAAHSHSPKDNVSPNGNGQAVAGNGNGNGNGNGAAAALAATLRTMRQLFILLIGLTVLLIGIVMIVLPGPSILVIPAGLAILSIEFAWARRWLAKFKSYLPKRKPKTTGALPQPTPSLPTGVPSPIPSSSVESR